MKTSNILHVAPFDNLPLMDPHFFLTRNRIFQQL